MWRNSLTVLVRLGSVGAATPAGPETARASTMSVHLSRMPISIRTPGDLVAAIPHLLGFQPEDSVVIVPTSRGLPVARIDFPHAAEDRERVWESIHSGFGRHARPDSSVAIVCLTNDHAEAASTARHLADRFASIGVGVELQLWVANDRWSDLVTGANDVVTVASRERLAAASVFAGQALPERSREDLANSLVGDPAPVAALLPEAREAAAESVPRLESDWALGILSRFETDGNRLTDRDAARLLVAVESSPIRDRLWDQMDRRTAAVDVAFWTDMTRRSPVEVRTAPAALLGFASWLHGDGARALCALDQVPQGQPYVLADLVSTALATGMHPREWDAIKTTKPASAGLDPSAARLSDRSAGRAWPTPEM